MTAKKISELAAATTPLAGTETVPIVQGGTTVKATAQDIADLVGLGSYATQAYVDAAIAGLSWKQAVRAATTAAGTLATDFENGDTLDGVTLATGDRILVKDQGTASENGIYIVAASGAPTRASDANSSAELVNASVYVSEGTTNADTQWTCTTNAPITVGSTSIAFAQLTSGGGMSDGDKGDITVSGSGSTFTVDNNAITYAKMQDVSATSRVLGRKTAGSGDPEEVTLSELLDFIGSAAQGDILYRGASGWARLAAGTAGYVLQTGGAGANPSWAAGSGGSGGTKTIDRFTPMTSQPPASNYATLDTRNSIAVLDFDASTNEYAFWVGIMPEGASLGSGLKIRLYWMATSATSGDVVWVANVERGNTDLDTDSFDTGATATGTANGTSGIVTVTEITQTNIDGVTAGDLYRLLIYRNAESGSDTMAGDAELIAVEVRSAA